MVHIPDENEKATGQHKQLPKRPASGPQRQSTDQNKRPPTGQQPAAPEKKTGPVAGPRPKQRSTQMLSLEPPKRKTGPSIAQMNTRLDSMGGPTTRSQRNRQLFGTVGREKSGQTGMNQAQPGQQSAAGQRPTLRKPGQGGEPVSLGGAGAAEPIIVRRKGTARIPKAGGGFQGEAAPLDSMGSGRRPSIDPGPPQRDVPPVVNMPVPQPRHVPPQDNPPPPPSARGNTLAGVSAEDLLGPEGRKMLEEMRRREQQARTQPQPPPPQQRPQQQPMQQPTRPQPLPPRMQDSSRMAFQSAEYGAPVTPEAPPDDELRPQDGFLAGPTRQIQRDVVQTPMPVDQGSYDQGYEEEPPPDDLGYERPVDFGGAHDEAQPQAPESAAQDEMEQRAGYLLWLQGVITREEVEDALTGSESIDDEVRDLLIDSAFTDQVTLHRFLARHESVSPVDLTVVRPTERALASLRPAIARAYRVIPIDRVGGLMLVAAAFPFDPKRLLELRRLTASKIKLYVVTEEEIDLALTRYYPGSAATLRSPKPAFSDSSVTGEGEALEGNYDPTLSGEDSGLYAPIDGPGGDTPDGVELSEADDRELDDEPPYRSEDDTIDDSAVPNSDDLDESTLDDVGNNEDGSDLDDDRQLHTGPEDLDPFA
jgi:hypothetical protein